MEERMGDIKFGRSRAVGKRALSDLNALAQDAEDLVKATAGDVGDRVKDARDRVSAAVDRARATLDETQQRTFASARAAAQRADTVVRDHPYETLGVFFGLGLVVGVLLVRA